MNKVIRKGDTLREYGGRVLMGHYQCFGLGFACKGDPVKCNKHGMTTIAEGSARTTMMASRLRCTVIAAPAAARWSALTQTAGLISEAGTGVSPVRRRATAWYGQVAIGFGPAGPA
ncbi:PaaR repeat-containing protein [Klebsiella pneumoniae]|uniref:PaaR repeat-containing protein n=1 Tax=Klebsiella pneumoniae TaxID=573 RepID=A0A378F4Q6_KLEPN|nr:PaaR repeat-containing protein [Klebsiella pneumoniae]